MVEWVVFDYGRVISRDTAALPSLAAMLGVTLEDFETAYAAERKRYDRGCGDLRYWQAVGVHLGVEVDPDLAGKLTDADADGWLETAPETLALIEDLRRAGTPLALLSNAPGSFARIVEGQPWARSFRQLIFSADLGLAKPDAEIYSVLLSTVGIAGTDCLFFDDKQENIDAARETGLHAELWRGAESARETLQEHGFVTAPD